MSMYASVVLRAATQEEDEINPLLPHWAEIIVGGVTFLLLLFLLSRFVLPRFEKAYKARTEAIEGGIERAEKAQADAQRALEQYTEQLAGARKEAARIRDDARAEGQQIIAEMRAQAQEEAARILQQGHDQLATQRTQIVMELRADLGRLAVDLAGRVIGESLADDARQRGTVDRFLAELDGMSSGAAPVGK